MEMDKNTKDTASGIRNPENRQVGDLVPVPDRSEAMPESCEGPIGELSASPPMDLAFAEDSYSSKEEGGLVIARRLGQKKKSPRRDNPRVVVVITLDKEVRVVPGPPPPLEVADPGSPRYVVSAPELGAYAECEPIDVRSLLRKELPTKASEPMEVSEVPEEKMEPREETEVVVGRDLPARSEDAPARPLWSVA